MSYIKNRYIKKLEKLEKKILEQKTQIEELEQEKQAIKEQLKKEIDEKNEEKRITTYLKQEFHR